MDRLIQSSGIALDLPVIDHIPANHRILVVDDYAPNIMIATAILDQFGYKYDVATNGMGALEWYEKAKYSVILMDIQMPEMSGLEATKQIRMHELKNKLAPTPIIALTANVSPNIREECSGSGMNSFLAKPYSAKCLQDAITNSL